MRLELTLKRLPQCAQAYGFSPVWMRMCFTRSEFWLKLCQHSPHVLVLGSPAADFGAFSFWRQRRPGGGPAGEKLFPQSTHLNGLGPRGRAATGTLGMPGETWNGRGTQGEAVET